MKDYNKDIDLQFAKILATSRSEMMKSKYSEELAEIFSAIYAINYLRNKVETKRYFNTTYFKITYSCLLESYSLILNNYPRGSSLVLRSAVENFIKHVINIINSEYNKSYNINDKSYSANKATLEKIISDVLKRSFEEINKGINGQMERQYRELSGLSHSLTPESISNTFNYFFDLDNVNKKNVDLVIVKFTQVSRLIFSLSIILCEPSLKLWERDELDGILNIIFGKRRRETYIKKLKE